MLAWSAGLAALTVRRNGVYRNELALWSDTVAKVAVNPNSQNNLGIALAAAGRPAEAIEQFGRAVALNPDYAEAHDNLALALAGVGRTAEAIGHYERALQLKPDYPDACANLGVALATSGRLPEAIAQFRRALQLNPNFVQARNNLAVALASTGRTADAVAEYEQVLRQGGETAEVHYNLGNALAQLERWPEAALHYQRALALAPNNLEARLTSGWHSPRRAGTRRRPTRTSARWPSTPTTRTPITIWDWPSRRWAARTRRPTSSRRAERLRCGRPRRYAMKARPWLLAGMILLVGGWIYWPALRGTWIWDDLAEIPNNPVLADPAGLGKIWAGASSPDYFPLKTTVQWVEWHLWGSQALGYHVTSIALHSLSALLLWRLLRQLGVRQAWVGGLLFMVHPLAVESVAWISELKNTLSLPPLLLAMSAYVRFEERRSETGAPGGWAAYALSLGWFAAALLAKSTVVLYPVVLLLYSWWRRGRIAGKDVRASLPFFALALGLGLVTVWFQEHRAAYGADLVIGGLASRLAGAGLAAVFYVSKSVLPLGLMPIYPRWTVVPPSALQYLPWVGLAAFSGWLWTRRGTDWGRAALFAWACFVASLLPVLGLIPMSYLRISWVADHFAYLALVPVAGLAAAGWSALSAPTAGRAAASWFRRPLFLGLALAAVGAALAAQSRREAEIYRDEGSFWTAAAQRNPGSWVAQNNLGLTVAREGRAAEAIDHYRTALRLNPNYAEADLSLANALLATGHATEAVGPYEAAARLQPLHPDTYAGLGLALAQSGRLPESVASYERALQLGPPSAQTENNLGNALARLGRGADAQAAYARALQLRPGYAEAERNWGNLLSESGQLAAAADHYRRAVALEPGDPEAHYRLANALANAGQLAQAIAEYGEAVRLRPDFAAAHANLGLALTGSGRVAAALAELQEAVRLDPKDAEAHAYYGFSLAKAGRLPEAIDQYERALELNAADADVHYNLALALRAAGRDRDAQVQFDVAARLGGGR